MSGDSLLDEAARRAIDGDRAALDTVVRALQSDIFALALRMLWNREDAEDATQEILVRIVTRLSRFDFHSRLKTWAFRVAVNYILDLKKSPVERLHLSFARFADDLADGLAADGPANGERSVLTEEVKIGCTIGMLQCLDRPHRLAYILGEVLDFSGPEAADVLDLAPTVFRKRLQRARDAVTSFARSYCGLVSDVAVCQCNHRVTAAVGLGRVRPDALDFAARASSFEEARALVRRVDQARWALELHRATRPRESSVDFARRLVHVIDSPPA